MKLSKGLATALIQCWHADVHLSRIDQALLAELPPYDAMWNQPARAFLHSRHKALSSGLWAGTVSDERAVQILTTHGMASKKGSKDVERPKSTGESYIVSGRLSGKYNWPKSDWKYVK